LAAPAQTKANTCTQRKQGGCQSPQWLFARIKSRSGGQIDKLQNKITVIKLQQGIFGFYI
jgi:hypothetical protein